MPTQSTTYNSRITDENLERRFRETFKSQAGAELIDDLYASGVVVPVVDFTAAAEGSGLPTNLQRAWDFSTGAARQSGSGTTTAISNSGFWNINIFSTVNLSSASVVGASITIFDGSSSKTVWAIEENIATPNEVFVNHSDNIVVFLRSGDSMRIGCTSGAECGVSYRQIADLYGNLTNPLGFVPQ